MICTTIRPGKDCNFMKSSGCSYNGGLCFEVVESCQGCSRTEEYSSKWYCTACPEPSVRWKNGACNMATHVKEEALAKAHKINPLKASKRAAKKK
ncbi:MAG: PxxKW family cysteine-rich protein [Pseudomonadota bacterium]